MEIQIFQPDDDTVADNTKLKDLISEVSDRLPADIERCTVIFVSDPELAELHKTYLNDPSFTDVMTFNLGDDTIEGEIYISVDRARMQAREYGVRVEEEIVRLVIHGLLHLNDYEDTNETQRLEMKAIEERLFEQYRRFV